MDCTKHIPLLACSLCIMCRPENWRYACNRSNVEFRPCWNHISTLHYMQKPYYPFQWSLEKNLPGANMILLIKTWNMLKLSLNFHSIVLLGIVLLIGLATTSGSRNQETWRILEIAFGSPLLNSLHLSLATSALLWKKITWYLCHPNGKKRNMSMPFRP
jgi:hypothetical protein